ncbi:MAG: zinc ribbon-containing protein [Gammaproteobacteria bacterium]|nr:zinc ribbon-containing protein [Gammaproteobacteria bacterium]
MTDRDEQTNVSRDKLAQAYDRMLERAEHGLAEVTGRSEAVLHHALDAAHGKAVELGELTHEEAEAVRAAVARDLHDAGTYIATEERELADWLRLSVLKVEKALHDRYAKLVQAAKLELNHLEKASRRLGEWQTGEVTMAGTLRCRKCGEQLNFERAGRIPPCPKCHATTFERVRA